MIIPSPINDKCGHGDSVTFVPMPECPRARFFDP
ncbi:hypothetical protein lam_762 [Candidatus Liberibacter americanus str. Sao Paulo]|uniref:Uncharacterized protein n=1 Tax=Candidatus Liberibacter americanus str. Sao Paulo TaxID=1261131 RepID=U6B5B0_9HYPH|nr:hypothetical protein lam_762 [Candidatus Liberibacter americanus str. Sao Paulo]